MQNRRTRISKRTSAARSKPRRQKSASPSETAAIVKVATPPERPWELTSEQVVLLKNYLKIADASEIELKGCLEVARRYRMDPFKQAQIWKCAKARAIRTAYPDLGGLYIPEECEKFNEDFTPSGRQIVVGAPTQGSHEAAQKVLQDKLAGNMPLNPAIDVPGQSESQQPTSPERQHPAQGGGGAASTGPASPSSRRDDVPAGTSGPPPRGAPPEISKGQNPGAG